MDAFELLEQAGHVDPADPAVVERAAAELLARCGQTARPEAAAGLVGGAGAAGPRAVSGPNRTHQRHRRVWLAAAAVVAAAATGVALTASLSQSQPQGPAAVHVNLAAWSVNSNPDGTVTLTMRQEDHAGLLQRVLREAGVPTIVRVNEKCGPTFHKGASGRVLGGGDGHPLTIRPSAIPRGADLLITLLSAQTWPVGPQHKSSEPHGYLMTFQLHPASQPLKCTYVPKPPPVQMHFNGGGKLAPFKLLEPFKPDAKPSAAK